jgi:dUTP pyrophosphatase|tara:strand:+ start:46 stop:573 length:528 start_codon:yes stop_codon:yes gene_type:complete
MKIKVKNTDTTLPKTSTSYDAGYDIVATSNPTISGVYNEEAHGWSRIDYIQYHTDLYIEPCIDETVYHTNIFPRSSISKYNLILANSIGLIDAGYRGELLVRFKYIYQPEDMFISVHGQQTSTPLFTKVNMDSIYSRGDRIGQLVIAETQTVEFEIVDELTNTDRGDGGFGSTGA